MSWGAIIFSLVVGGIFSIWMLYIDSNNKSKKKEKLKEKLKELNIESTQEYLDENITKYMCIDENNSKICLISINDIEKENYNVNIYSFSDILETEIIENENSISKMSKTSVAGRAILGGVLFGGVGAVIGGFSANKNNFENIEKIYLRLIVNNTLSPFFEIVFFDKDIKKNTIKKNSLDHSNIMNQVNHWHSLFSIIIKNANK